MLKGKRPVMSEENNSRFRCFDLLKHGAIVRGEYSSEGIAFVNVLPGTNNTIEYSGTMSTDVDKFLFLHEDALVANAMHLVTAHANLVEKTQYGVDCLVGCGMLNVVRLPGIDAESLGVPQLPVVVEKRGVVGEGDARGDEGKSE